MAFTVAEYSSAEFNSLLDFSDVLSAFDRLDGDKLVNGPIKDLFRRHNVQGTIGLALLHKHFNIYDGERVTDVRGTSNPVTFELGEASTWGLSPERRQLVPVEYSITQSKIDWQTLTMQAFLTEFSEMMVSIVADGILGLCAYPGDGYPGRVEFTVGRSNVNLTPQEANLLPSVGTREAAWFYSDDFIRRGCRCNCFKTQKHTHSHGYTVSS
ncbi:hypothetical protein C7999DRAFT_18093 [Corynascus novoguineensis]|uniref:Uncharacterized protein n=1 Tax=Corynascus novoguineensis TaxID=1126955 RepID=A0AAN7CK69_9PEZI|nr:hypothetical protein C7999DRAFT_18093 [Corynascus novoguineensis]